jgi:hypothetical protein
MYDWRRLQWVGPTTDPPHRVRLHRLPTFARAPCLPLPSSLSRLLSTLGLALVATGAAAHSPPACSGDDDDLIIEDFPEQLPEQESEQRIHKPAASSSARTATAQDEALPLDAKDKKGGPLRPRSKCCAMQWAASNRCCRLIDLTLLCKAVTCACACPAAALTSKLLPLRADRRAAIKHLVLARSSIGEPSSVRRIACAERLLRTPLDSLGSFLGRLLPLTALRRGHRAMRQMRPRQRRRASPRQHRRRPSLGRLSTMPMCLYVAPYAGSRYHDAFDFLSFVGG